MRQRGNNKCQTWPLKRKIGSGHFSSQEWDQEERDSNCTVRYFSNKFTFPDRGVYNPGVAYGRGERENAFPQVHKEMSLLGNCNAQRQTD